MPSETVALPAVLGGVRALRVPVQERRPDDSGAGGPDQAGGQAVLGPPQSGAHR